MTTTYLAADTINGVYKISQEDAGELLSGAEFLASLKDASDDEVLFTAVDAIMRKKIDDEYGIK